MRFDHDVEVVDNGQREKVEAGKSYEIKSDKPIQIESAGKVPMLIYPIKSSDKDLAIKLPDLDETKVSEFQKGQVNRMLDGLMPEIQKVQVMMIKNDYINALSKVRDLKTQYPGIAYLSFVEGACYSVMKRNGEAVRALREGLDIYSESSDAKELYRKISGEN